MQESFIPLSVPNLKGNELAYVTKAIEDEWVSTGGSFIDAFEKKTAEYVGAEGAVACQSGTAGIHLALLANGIGQADEVVVPALTFVAAVNPVKYAGAEPVFMDCDDSLCMDMDKLEEFCRTQCTIKNGTLFNNKTGNPVKAVIVVHIFGNMADMEKAKCIAETYHLQLIEDATEALGSYVTEGAYEGRFAGTIGDIGIYSYNGNKIITTGGGGMIVSNNKHLLKHAKYLSTQAKDDALHYVHNDIGYNYRMTNLQAAVGLAQMEQLENFIQIKRKNYLAYIENGIELLQFRKNIRPNYWFYSILTEERDELINYLNKNKIQARPAWKPVCDLKPYEKAQHYKIQKAIWYWERIVNIPCSSNLSDKEVDRVSEALKLFR